MDANFLEFWENLLVGIARGQIMISFADVSKDMSVKETGRSVVAENDKG